MADYYDYEMLKLADGTECYSLRRNGAFLGGIGRYARIEVKTDVNGAVFYDLITQWQRGRGPDSCTFRDLDKAMQAGSSWAIRRRSEEA